MIVFSFSKTEVEGLSAQMISMDINDDSEKVLVEQVFRNAVDCLGEEDRKLPQVCVRCVLMDQIAGRRFLSC